MFFKKLKITIFCVVIFLSAVVLGKENTEKQNKSVIIIDGTKKKLYLVKDKIIYTFPVAIGLGGLGKNKFSDKKTPLGEYEISWMASKISSKGEKIIDGKTWCKDSQFYYGDEEQPGEDLWTIAFGGEQATIMGLNYPTEEEKKNGYTGSCISIHASRHKKPQPLKPSLGCIKMYPDDALKLYNNIEIRTKVYILKNYK